MSAIFPYLQNKGQVGNKQGTGEFTDLGSNSPNNVNASKRYS